MKTGKKQSATRTEYRLLLRATTSEDNRTAITELTLETSRQFASFKYELGVEENLTQDSLHLRVTGLRTPALSLPTSGPATFRKEYQDLSGPLDITIQGLDGKESSFRVEISRGLVRLVNAPQATFVEIVTGNT